MIRKLTAADHPSVMRLLTAEPAFNAFIIGDIEHFGYEREFQQLWGEFRPVEPGAEPEPGLKTAGSDSRVPAAVLLRYHSHCVLYAPGPHDAAGFAALLGRTEGVKAFSGKAQALDVYGALLPEASVRRLTYARLDPGSFRPSASGRPEAARRSRPPPGPAVPPLPVIPVKALPEDAAGIYRLRSIIPEFSGFSVSVAGIRARLETGLGRTYLVKKRGAVIAAASTTAESSLGAVIGGVMTHPGYRRSGLASACLRALCRELLGESKFVCLFYDNPSAARIYRSMGFSDIGRWIMYVW